ncbi:MAG: sigma-70 family RNA polymerase sigma factor [Ruminococcaceae bacterium]|nr:sigma-70 family RNA polymerase sigma factor [Oscillospiraceae bacterium]
MLSFLLNMVSKCFCLILRTSDTHSFPPPLPRDEEHELFIKARKGDISARNKLIEHNLRLVAHIVKKYYTASPDQDDLISVGTIGLIKAIDSFNIENGARFATYAGKCLQNEILMYFRSQKKHANVTSINEPVDVDKEGNPLTYLEIIASPDDIVDSIDRKIKLEKIMTAIKTVLTDRERKIMTLRYGLNKSGKHYAQRDVARMLGISRSYVSRLEKSAVEKIREFSKR